MEQTEGVFHVERNDQESIMQIIEGNIVDIVQKSIFPGKIFIEKGKIEKIENTGKTYSNFIIPGFVDAHVHVESSMVTPLEFSKAAVRHGTIGAICDPHEIANVLGAEGVRFMVENGKKSPFKFLFGVPSCVPATAFESSGAVLGPQEIEKLFDKDHLSFLAEMMNFPGVVHGDDGVMEKIRMAKNRDLPVDGHAPGLTGKDLKKYVHAGISTDHECTTREEALEKMKLGMKILIREGSAAKNFDDLIQLLLLHPEQVMFCTDDLHPDELIKEHINEIVKRAVQRKINVFNVLRSASFNPVRHYGLNMGLLQPSDPADFVIVDNLDEFNILGTYIDGEKVFGEEGVLITGSSREHPNRFVSRSVTPEEIRLVPSGKYARIIGARDGALWTEQIIREIQDGENSLQPDTENDVLKIAVVNRYDPRGTCSAGLIHGFGLLRGAIGSSIAHDSHNVICIGTEDTAMIETINWIFKQGGGIAVHDGNQLHGLSLPVAGLMSDKPVEETGRIYQELSRKVNELGSTFHAPFMTLSFMALLVIPSLKIGDRGLFDVNKFAFTSLFLDQ